MSQQGLDDIKQRLKGLGHFSKETIDGVIEVARLQQSFPTYQPFFDELNLSTPHLFEGLNGGVTVVDLPARQRPEAGVLVVHLPMANPLDTNQLYQVATITAANPSYRIIAFGNPSGGRYSYPVQNLSAQKRTAIANGSGIQYLVEVEVEYLKSQNITTVSHAGYSYGALKAVIESYYSGDVTVENIIVIDPAAHPRGLVQLAGDFLRTDLRLNTYVNRANTPAFIEARKAAVTGNEYKVGLLRPINRAIIRLLSKTDFIDLLTKTMVRHPHVKVTLAWAAKSELGNDAHFKSSTHHLSQAMPGRLRPMRFGDDYHALANDIHLHAAIIREGLS